MKVCTKHVFIIYSSPALTDILGSSSEAILTAGRVLRVSGQNNPVTTDNVHIQATYDDGVVTVGEHSIDAPSPERVTNSIIELTFLLPG